MFSQASSSDLNTQNSVQTNLLALHLHRTVVHFVFEQPHLTSMRMATGASGKIVIMGKEVDTVWHRGLLYKLKHYGISGSTLEWFSDYLSDHKQRVINEGFKSIWERTLAGFPQGSVLGLYLFLLYINDIVNNIETYMRFFADDTSLFVIENEESIKLLKGTSSQLQTGLTIG